MTPASVLAVGLLALVLVAATVRPFGLPEAVLAIPAAGVAVLAGLVSPATAWREVTDLGPTIGFLAAILLLGHLADAEGVFRWLGARLATASRGSPRRLLALVTVAAAVTTAALSLDATVVLLTPVVLATAAGLHLPPRPHSYACAHLSNSASGLLPVSNLTNLLAFSASGLSFLGFAGLMAAPWVVVVAVEYVVLRWFFARDLPAGRTEVVPAPAGPAPVAALAVLGLTLAGFGASSALGVAPGWVAAAGAAVLAVRALVRREIGVSGLVTAASPGFCVFVLALGVVVAGVSGQGLAARLGGLLPGDVSFGALLATAVIAAVLANVVNNLPATLVLLTALGPSPSAGLVLAMLLGVNIGPNLTWTGSLATLLWRRVSAARGAAPSFPTFAGLGLLTVPLGLVGATAALWAALRLAGRAP
ncbi:SLC13 family permease [Pseudonocardia phyllosphaerae]|uniref:SLC13 family permease n=1 Tax=Pseudonocardia phyllosphaerae TaxID=3390502 RepID=UPI00397E47B2